MREYHLLRTKCGPRRALRIVRPFGIARAIVQKTFFGPMQARTKLCE